MYGMYFSVFGMPCNSTLRRSNLFQNVRLCRVRVAGAPRGAVSFGRAPRAWAHPAVADRPWYDTNACATVAFLIFYLLNFTTNL